ncbi:putative dehydrogenase [Streptacidiphilus sp. MAP12-33]|uniref:Gfo/Idh/MocA family protein n=1 Tax=Streptacidiphilus sp. MAP12-33 TaxID=3156266 RepID=UPI0035196AB1
MTIGVGLVGFGVAGRQHAAALEGQSFACVRAVFDHDPGLDTGELHRVHGWDELLADRTVDLVSLCIPPGGRAAAAQQALEAGKAVLVETPPAVSVAEIDLLLDIAEKHGRPVGVMLQHRQSIPEQVEGWDWTAASAVLEVSWYQPPAHYERAHWRQDPLVSLGGITAHRGVHYLDLACRVLGEPRSVRLAGKRERVAGIDSRIAGTVEFENESTLALVVTGESTAQVECLEVLGKDKRLRIRDGGVTVQDGRQIEDLPAVSTRELRAEVYREMAHAIVAGTEAERFGVRQARAVAWILEQTVGALRLGNQPGV